MNQSVSIDSLRTIQFLQSFTDENLQSILDISELFLFDQGEILFREGNRAEFVYLIVFGNVSLEICAAGIGCKRILTIGPGEMLGCSTILEQSQLNETATALETTSVLRIKGEALLTLCEHDPKFGLTLMRRTALALAKRLDATRLQLLDVFGSHMPEVDS